ncbi:MAG: hypothetical protein FJ215_01100 [Ignavibacteria bacterium]|nr:hypothetical protein [Ignavibacteria bacterium]
MNRWTGPATSNPCFRERLLLGFFLLTIMIAGGCKKDDPVQPGNEPTPASSPYAGEWRGTTNEGLPIYFRVLSSGVIDSCTTQIRFTYGSFTCDLGFRAPVDTSIQNGAFVIPMTGVASTKVRGSFSSNTNASGTYDSFSSEIFILSCNNSLYQGRVSHTAGTWQATRQ